MLTTMIAVAVRRGAWQVVGEGAMNLAQVEEQSELAASLDVMRRSTARWLLQERDRTRVTTGIPALDLPLAGGWPKGRVGELVGAISSGRTSVATATMAAATRNGELVAWIDAADGFDPGAAREAGVVLERVLWVRSTGLGQTIRAAEVVLESGIPVVVVDLAGGWGAMPADCRRGRGAEVGAATGFGSSPPGLDARCSARTARPAHLEGAVATREPAGRVGERGQRRGALRLRLARAVERAGAVTLVITEQPWVGALAGLTVTLTHGTARWGGKRGSPRWLTGLTASFRVGRGSSNEIGGGVDFRRVEEGEADGDRASPPAERPVLASGARFVTPPGPAVSTSSDLRSSIVDLRSVHRAEASAHGAGG